MELIPAKRQRDWGRPAIASFFLGGMASGYYLLSLLAENLSQGVPRADAFKLIAPLLAAAGFLTLATEAGRPMRSIYLLSHLRGSWMSRETLAGGIFVVAAPLERIFLHPALLALGVLSAFSLLLSQAFVLRRSPAVTSWDTPLLPPVILSSGLTTGSGLMLLISADGVSGFADAGIALTCVSLDIFVWLRYLRHPGPAAFLQATAALRQTRSLLSIVGIGRLPPALLVLATLHPGLGGGARLTALFLAGLTMIAGGAIQKVALLRNVAYLRGIKVSD